MRVELRFFALVRERIGTGAQSLELPAGSVVADVTQHVADAYPDLAPLLRTSMVMCNQEYVDATQVLMDGDEIAFIPPVSGGDHVRVTPDVLDQHAIARAVEQDGAGAVVTFVGTVRDNARGRRVLWLDYEAYPAAAEKMLAQIAEEMRARWPILGVAVEHRTGRLDIGEASVVIAVSSAHRDAAFAACAYCIERIKQIVPVWKKEAYEDGEVWIGSEAAYQVETGRTVATSGA